MNRYPVWKYAILVVALLVGVLYTLPNFFGEAPAVQVSSGKATVKVDNVKKAGDTAYTADLTVSIHGVEKVWPVNFTVVTSTPDSVTIAVKQPFGRADFSVGPKETDNIKNELTLDAVVTFKKS